MVFLIVVAAKKFLASREGAAEGSSRGEFRRARAFRWSEAEAGQFRSKKFRAKFIGFVKPRQRRGADPADDAPA